MTLLSARLKGGGARLLWSQLRTEGYTDRESLMLLRAGDLQAPPFRLSLVLVVLHATVRQGNAVSLHRCNLSQTLARDVDVALMKLNAAIGKCDFRCALASVA